MAEVSQTQKVRVNKWFDRIRAADKAYENWSKEYNTTRLEKYYCGKQWQGMAEDQAAKRYVINLVFATVETNKPSMVFNNPQVRMTVRPGVADDLASHAQDRIQLCQETVQSFMDDEDFGFQEETSLALHEAHFRYGVIEVGYTADWIDNPDAGKPMMKERSKDDGETEPEGQETEPLPILDESGEPVLQPERLIKKERLFLKRIPAENFRVSISNKNRVANNDWVGYFEWHLVEDIKKNPLYKKGSVGLKATGSLAREYQEGVRDGETEEERLQHNGMVKVWKIWDLRTGKKKVMAEGHERYLAELGPFSFLPFAVLRFYPILNSFYPLPPVSQWLGPQDEINETRDAQRAHRQRFYRRYTMQRNAMDPEELEKIETGGDGVVAISNQPNPLNPVPDAPMGSDVWAHLDASKTDFQQVTATGGDQRGVAESETATQAQIIAKQAQLRDSYARTRVQEWLAAICRLMLLTIREDMALPFWIKRNVDLTAVPENQASEMLRVAQLWKEITAEDLGTADVGVTIDLSTMSPVAQEQDKIAWNQVLGLITNPTLVSVLAMSPALLKKTLRLYGVTSQTEIAEIQQVFQQMLMMQVAAAQAQAAEAGPAGSGKSEGGGGQPTPPGETPAEMQGTVM